MSVVVLAGAVVALIAIQAFFAASEIALISADELKVRAEGERGSSRARMLAALLENRDRTLALTLTGTCLVTVSAAAMLTSYLHGYGRFVSLLAPFLLTPLCLLLGESLPKMIALRNPHRFAIVGAPVLRVMSSALAPLLAAETAASRLMRSMLGVPADAESIFIRRDDLARLARRGGEAAAAGADAIEPAEQRMISRIFRFASADARKAMVPLVRVEAVPIESTLGAVIETVRREGFSRIPVFRRRITDIVGVVHVFDLLRAPDLSRPVSEVMRPVSYFPESMPLDEVLIAMQRTGENLSVIVDEYGGAAGIIALEDLLEEIVGEIEDEHDLAEDLARQTGPRTLTVVGSAPVAELNDRYGLKLPEEDGYATIGGLVVERLGHIPKPGEQLSAGDASITVTRSDSRAVREVSVTLPRPIRTDAPRRK